MSEKSTNQIIFEWLNPDVCWHEYDPNRQAWIKKYWMGVVSHYVSNPDRDLCIKCGKDAGIPLKVHDEPMVSTAIDVPDYENDLNAVHEAELKAIEVFGAETYAVAVCRTIRCTIPHAYVELIPFITAPASVRAEAVRKLIEG